MEQVIKAGGSVLRRRDDFAHVARCLHTEAGRAPVWAVLSAAHGVTERLLRLAQGPEDALGSLVAHHEDLADAPLPGAQVRALGDALQECRRGVHHPLIAWGEQASVDVLRTHLHRIGAPAPVVELGPRLEAPATSLRLVPGFYYRTPGGGVRLLPRGGSDVTAVHLAVRLKIPRVRFWKDTGAVHGPRGRPLRSIGSGELLHVIGSGTQPLHPAAVLLARRRGVALVVEAPGGPVGTRVVAAPHAT